ncbi:MAG: hypothetical protein ABIG32_00800 [Candidatus Uhrbacteria bacterium]
MKQRGEAMRIQPESEELSLELDSAEMETQVNPEAHVKVDGVPVVDSEGNHVEGLTEGEPQEMDFDFLNTKLVDAYINEIPTPEMGEFFTMARFKKRTHTGTQIVGVPIPERITFLTDERIKAKRAAGDEPVYYQMTQVLGQGGMGMAIEAEAVNEHGEEIEGMKPIVVKFAYDMNDSVANRRIVRETALHAVLNPDEQANPDLSQHLQASYKGTRARGKIEKIPAFQGAVKYKVPSGEVYMVGMERIPGYDLSEYGLKEYTLPMEPAMKSMFAVAKTLADMHERGILHRDLKPANIMGDMNDPENTRLIDLGISKDVFQEMVETADVSVREKVLEASFYEAKINQLLGEAGRVAPIDLKVKLEDEMVKFRKARDHKNVLDMEQVLDVLEKIYGELVEPEQQEKAPKTDSLIPSQITQAGVAVGTPYYMTKAVVNGEPADPLSDVGALAKVYLHMSKGARFNHSKKISEVVNMISRGEFIEPYDPGSPEYKNRFRTDSEREFADLLYEANKDPSPAYLHEVYVHLDSETGLEDIDFARLKLYLEWAAKQRTLTEVEKNLFDVSKRIEDIHKESPKEMRDQAEPLVREYLSQFMDWKMQQRGMHEVVQRLSQIVEMNNRELGERWQGPVREVRDEEAEEERLLARAEREAALTGVAEKIAPEIILPAAEEEIETLPDEEETEEEKRLASKAKKRA